MNCHNYIGLTGPTGPTGIGIPGTQGLTGPTGPLGPTGPSQRGDTGPTGVKSFVIDHPINSQKYLVHACLEGPEAGVYYRGMGEVVDGHSTTIRLPEYCHFTNYTTHLTPIFDGQIKHYNASPINSCSVTIHGPNGRFYWSVYGSRQDINVEVEKTPLYGSGPYLHI